MSRIDWQPWCEDSFRRAQHMDRPVLLSIVAGWSARCRQMDEEAFADPAVAAAVASGWLPVRVDADLRPDVARRFQMGGWPTTAFLSDAGELVGGGTCMPAERLGPLLERLAQLFRSEPESLQRAAAEHQRREISLQRGEGSVEDLSLAIPDDVLAAADEAYDAEHGGFGRAPKLPLPRLLQLLADEVFWRRDGQLAARLGETLGALAFSPLWDESEYGFYRRGNQPDWSDPEPEKLLLDNAALLEAYIAAWRVLLDPSWRMVAEGILEFMHRRLESAGGGFVACGGQESIQVDVSATGAAAYLGAWVHFGGEHRDFALGTLERLWNEAWRPGDGFRHTLGTAEQPAPFLDDQVAMLRALRAAHEQTGEAAWLERAELVARLLLTRFWDGEAGAFRDLPCDHADPLLRILRPFQLNAMAAEELLHLELLAAGGGYGAVARTALAAGFDLYPHLGYRAASYARAVAQSVREPLVVELAVDPRGPDAAAFARAAQLRYHPWRATRWLPAGGRPAGFALWGERGAGPAETPDALDAAVAGLRPEGGAA